MRQHQREERPNTLPRRRGEGGDALWRVGIEIEAPAFERQVHGPAARGGHRERPLAQFAIKLELRPGQPHIG
ncbi:MAG: hypothetical protein ACK559_24735 [bacterium]